MEDVLSFHTRAYKKSDDLKKITPWQRTITLAQAVPVLTVKLFIVSIALVFEWFSQIFHCFVPKPLNDIRGQLAVVSGKISYRKCYKNFTLYRKFTFFATYIWKGNRWEQWNWKRNLPGTGTMWLQYCLFGCRLQCCQATVQWDKTSRSEGECL